MLFIGLSLCLKPHGLRYSYRMSEAASAASSLNLPSDSTAEREASILATFKQRIALHLLSKSNEVSYHDASVAEDTDEDDEEATTSSAQIFAQTDANLRRWLIARDWNHEAAVAMYEMAASFRLRHRQERLLTPAAYQRLPEVLRRFLPGGFVGFDREGHPVRVELFGALDLPGLLRASRWRQLRRAKLRECETALRLCRRQSRRLGRPVIGMTVVFDMAGATARFLWPPGVAAYMRLVRTLEDNYPELVRRLLVVNSPGVFPLLHRICQPLLSRSMRDKIFVLSNDPRQAAASLLKHIAADQLPAYLGGELRDDDGDPRCASIICQGGTVPQSYHASDDNSDGSEQDSDNDE